MLNFKSIKTQLIIFLVCLAVFLSIRDRDTLFLFTIAIAVIFTLMLELIIFYFRKKSFQITESSVITGLIIGYVLYSGQPWWKFILASSLAIISKYLIRFQKKHIFNPAAFGIFAVLFLGAETQWKGAYVWYMLLFFGIYFAKKVKKLEILIGYFVVALGLFAIQAVFQKAPLWLIFGYLNYFYIFVMIIEPKTSPLTPIGKYCFGASIAGLVFILTELGVKFDVELFSLLIMNMFVPLLNRFTLAKGVKR